MKKYIEYVIKRVKNRKAFFILISSLIMLLTNALLAVSELTHDPSIDPIPEWDFNNSEKAVVVGLNFSNHSDVEVESVSILPGPVRGHEGEAPMLRVELLDIDNNPIEGFNAWHPLYIRRYGDISERIQILSEGGGEITFPFTSKVATAEVTNIETDQKLISVDLIPDFHDFCRNNPDDPDCEEIVNRPPICDANGPYSEECSGKDTSVTLDGSGSIDHDDDPLNYSWSGLFTNGTATGPTPTVLFSDVGKFTVDLTVEDDFGGTGMCYTEVSIVDTTPPTIECNTPATITPPDAPISFTTSATDICVGQISASITGFDCYTLTKKGKRIDKTESCVVQIDGDTIIIEDSGGVGDHITWIVFARDDSGNTNEISCEVEVVLP